MKNIVIRMVNGDEYHLHDTKITILRTRNFDDLFQFIKWEDAKPTSIEELLKNCEVTENA